MFDEVSEALVAAQNVIDWENGLAKEKLAEERLANEELAEVMVFDNDVTLQDVPTIPTYNNLFDNSTLQQVPTVPTYVESTEAEKMSCRR
jgi:hypothetical protein